MKTAKICGARHLNISFGTWHFCTLPAGHLPKNQHEEEVEMLTGNNSIHAWSAYPGDICQDPGCGNAAHERGYCRDCLPKSPTGWKLRRIFRRNARSLATKVWRFLRDLRR